MDPIKYGKYELLERIARGGMAEVYKARIRGAAGFEKVVAIKKLHAHLSEDQEMVDMLKDEARLTSNMVHPNICPVLDLGRVEDTYYIAMAYIHGKDLSTIARFERKQGRKIPLDIALYFIRQTLTGLDYAHRQADAATGRALDIIHRDISPQNILVSYNGGVQIIDFGIAKAAETIHHTQNSVIKGKFRYMAPEQASGHPIDHRVDIFAAGVVLYELLLGDVHSRGASEAQLILKAQGAQFEPIGKLVPDLPLGLDLAVMKALAQDRENRFPSARTFRNALDTIVQREGLEVAPEAVASYLSSLFPDPHTRGSRVEEVEQLSARDILEFSQEYESRSSGGYRPVAVGAHPASRPNSLPQQGNRRPLPSTPQPVGGGMPPRGRSGPYPGAPIGAPVGGFSAPGPKPLPPGGRRQSRHHAKGEAPRQDYNYYDETSPPPTEGAPPMVVPVGAGGGNYDYFGKSQVGAARQSQELLATSSLPESGQVAEEFQQVEANPVGLTKATSETGRERRRRERAERKAAAAKREAEQEQSAAKRDYGALPPKKRDPVVGPFLERFAKALGQTLFNTLLVLLLLASGIGIYRYTQKSSKAGQRELLAGDSHKRGATCTRGLVYLNIRTLPSGATLFIDGNAVGYPSPVNNVEYSMCYNIPTVIRAEKGMLAGEAKVKYPLSGKSVVVTIRLTRDGKGSAQLQGGESDRVSNPHSRGHSVRTAGRHHSRPEKGNKEEHAKPPQGERSSPTDKKGAPQEPDPVVPSDSPELAGGIGVLKISCSKRCRPFVNGRDKKGRLQFRLRARRKPYLVKVRWSDGSFSPAKKVYVKPYQDNFVGF